MRADGGPPRGLWGKGALARQLLLRLTPLVVAVILLALTVSVVAARATLVRELDAQLDDVMQRSMNSGQVGPSNPEQLLGLPGLPLGAVAILVTDGGPLGVVLTKDGPVQLSDATKQRLSSLELDTKQDLNLDDLGEYRVLGTAGTVITNRVSKPAKAFWGLPLHEINSTTGALVGVGVAIGLASIALVGGIVVLVVRRSLAPLGRVAGVAHVVSRMPLDSGDVTLGIRVAPEDANPEAESGRVGLAINHMLDNVEGALEARQHSETKVRQFVADASHELRNPLAAILGYSELIRRQDDDLPGDVAIAVTHIDRESQRMSRLVQDLLLLARLDSDPQLQRQPIDVNLLLANALSDAQAISPDHSWELELPDDPLMVSGDQDRLQQAIANLLRNAATHTPPGTVVTAALRDLGEGRVRISVADDGPGIPPALQRTVFERFVRGDTSRAHGATDSTGLGLSIVAAIVEAHRGSLRLVSEPGHTAFVIDLPTEPPHAN